MATEAKVIEARFATTRIAEAIADERPVDWSPAERALGSDARTIDNLRLLDDVARAFRSVGDQPIRADAPQPLFRWGPLEVSARLGEGHSGEVFRAWDPTLQRDVALKLRAHRDPLSDPANAQLMAEARQLARIRHRNVLAVYGAAVHDGRAGIWSELIEGRTLAQIVAADGPCGADEALGIALEVARALGVVHAAGLVHGDVKAENVMRERGGRIVLMDFGASGRREDLAARSVVSGTRRYLSPEVLAGSPPDARSDLYALGVLLHHLLTGAFPR
ncbi:MAG TPA: serine/threonine-protein kinase, partial [Dokdonella sp.]